MLLELGFGDRLSHFWELEFLRGYLEKVRSCVWEYFFLSLSMGNNSSASSKRITSRISLFGSSSSTECISRKVGQGSKQFLAQNILKICLNRVTDQADKLFSAENLGPRFCRYIFDSGKRTHSNNGEMGHDAGSTNGLAPHSGKPYE